MDYERAGVRFREIEEKLDLHFENRELLGQAFIHDSYLNELTKDQRKQIQSNERLEFLGDVVIGLAISEYHFNKSKAGEGELTEKRKINVRRKAVAEAARGLELGKYLVMSQGERLDRGEEKKKILAGCFEALAGAIFLQFGYEKARQFVLKSLV